MYHLPLELQRKIYEYDDTYLRYFRKYITYLLRHRPTNSFLLPDGHYRLQAFRRYDELGDVYIAYYHVCTDPKL